MYHHRERETCQSVVWSTLERLVSHLAGAQNSLVDGKYSILSGQWHSIGEAVVFDVFAGVLGSKRAILILVLNIKTNLKPSILWPNMPKTAEHLREQPLRPVFLHLGHCSCRHNTCCCDISGGWDGLRLQGCASKGTRSANSETYYNENEISKNEWIIKWCVSNSTI